MNQPNPQTQNPYAPTVNVAEPARTLVTTIPLGQGEINFAGQLTKKDVRNAVRQKRWRWTSLILVAPILLFGLFAFRGGAPSLISMLFFGVFFLIGPAFLLSVDIVKSLGWLQARQVLRRNPKMLQPMQGSMTETHLTMTTSEGWARLKWSGIAGAKVTDEGAVLAMNSAHGTLIILPARFFAPSDWEIVRGALQDLAARVPFVRGANSAAELYELTNGEVEELETIFSDLPANRIMLDGVITVGDVLRTSHGYWMVGKLIAWIVITVVSALILLLGLELRGSIVLAAFALAVVPLPLAIRCALIIYAMLFKSDQALAKLKCAVAEEGIWNASPRGVGHSRWTEFGDAVFSRRSIILKQSQDSISLVVFSRQMLVNPADWEPLQALIRQKVLGEQ